MKSAPILLLLSACTLLTGCAGRHATLGQGFNPLFTGKDLSGWKGFTADPPNRASMDAAAQTAADERAKAHWSFVPDGWRRVLKYDGQGDSLVSARDYTDFRLLIDWKIEKGGDSGIYLRGCPQVQIWDHPMGSGGLYNNQKGLAKPLIFADNPVGEWNEFDITLIGDRVTVWLNDTLVVDDVILENYFDRSQPLYPTGPIELQNHGNTLWFRDAQIREITDGRTGARFGPEGRQRMEKSKS
jgi:hypothetical protein